MLLNVSTDNLYDPIIALYEALFRGEREHTLRITLREDFNPVLLDDFLSLVQEGEKDFSATFAVEVIDEAIVLQ